MASVLPELLQCGSFPQSTALQEQPATAVPHGLHVLPETLLQCENFSTGSCVDCPQSVASFNACLPAVMWVLHGLQCGYLLECGPPWAAGGQPASPSSSLWAAEEPLLQLLEHLLLLLH